MALDIHAITLDLDDTIWPIAPAIDRAEAALDAWLLAQCGVVIKTPSLLSAWSAIFNPRLRFVLVGAPRRERRLLRQR